MNVLILIKWYTNCCLVKKKASTQKGYTILGVYMYVKRIARWQVLKHVPS